MIADQIQKTNQTLEERGLSPDSYFEVVFADGSAISEKDVNWSEFAVQKEAEFVDKKKVFYVSKFPVKSIRISFAGKEIYIDSIPEDAEVYQFIRSERLLATGIDQQTVVGRGVGLIKNGCVIEERFINALENSIQGVRK